MRTADSILIAGCGYVGSALAEQLVTSGKTVWGLKRSPRGLPDEVRAVEADVADPDTLVTIPDRIGTVDSVVYAVSADGFSDDAYRRAYVDGPRNLLDALGGSRPPRRFVLVSSTGVYGDAAGDWVDETTPPKPDGFSGRRLLEGEGLLLERTDQLADGAVVARFGGMYGPGRTRLIDQVRHGEARCTDGEPVWTNRIHRDDCAGVLAHLLALDDPDPVYVGVDTEPAERCEVLRWIAREIGAPEPPVEPAEEAPGRRRGTKRCDSTRLQRSGYRFLYPTFREGYGALLRRE